MIKRLIFHLLFIGVIFFLLDEYLLTDKFSVTGGWQGYVTVTIVFSVIMSVVKPVVKAIASPLSFLTLGLFSFVINAAMLWLLEHTLEFLDLGATISVSDWTMYPIIGFFMAVVMVLIP